MRDKDSLYTGYNSANKGKAQRLRREMTKQEKHLWHDFLKTYPIRFYRQRPIDRYIVDFYCSAAGLVIELDGEQHGEHDALAYDQERTNVLQEYGLEVLRFSNGDVYSSFENVCYTIHNAVRKKIQEAGDPAKISLLRDLEQSWETSPL